MKFNAVVTAAFVGLALSGTAAQAQSFTEGFNGTALPTGWVTSNLSTSASAAGVWRIATGITNGASVTVVSPYEGASFAAVSFNSISTGAGTINNWLLSPTITGMKNGDSFSFYTTTTPSSAYPDALEFRLSTAGSGTDVGTTTTSVGTFTTTLLSINPALNVGGYPETWTRYSVTLSGLAAPVTGRVALRYFVTDGGPLGDNSNIIGVDQFSYVSATPVPEPASWALSLVGIAGVAGLVRARRNKAA